MQNHSHFEARPIRADVWLYLDEIAHRMVNDYSVMLAVLGRTARGMTDPDGLAALEGVASRLRASAAACCTLRPPIDAAERRLDKDLERLCASLTSSLLADRAIHLTLACEPILLAARRSWQLSLVVSELVMNAVRHGFASCESGAIRVDVCATDRAIRCAVMDSGVGDPEAAAGRGSAILDALASDMGGTIVRRFSRAGSTVVLCVPLT